MKKASPDRPGRAVWLARLATVLACAASCAAVTAAVAVDNPYMAIGGRNAFALKPPVVVSNTPTTPVTPAAGIDLQGITTILGRPQVFLRLKVPGRPPKPPEDQSIVLEAGQREGDVEVLSIDIAEGVVRLKNRGDEATLTMKDNAATPSNVAPAPNVPAANPVPGIPRPVLPGISAPGVPAQVSANPPPTSPFGSGNPTAGNMPTRSLRSNPSGLNQPQTQNDARRLPLEAQMALIEVERERTRNAVESGKMPPLPPINLPTTPGTE